METLNIKIFRRIPSFTKENYINLYFYLLKRAIENLESNKKDDSSMPVIKQRTFFFEPQSTANSNYIPPNKSSSLYWKKIIDSIFNQIKIIDINQSCPEIAYKILHFYIKKIILPKFILFQKQDKIDINYVYNRHLQFSYYIIDNKSSANFSEEKVPLIFDEMDDVNQKKKINIFVGKFDLLKIMNKKQTIKMKKSDITNTFVFADKKYSCENNMLFTGIPKLDFLSTNFDFIVPQSSNLFRTQKNKAKIRNHSMNSNLSSKITNNCNYKNRVIGIRTKKYSSLSLNCYNSENNKSNSLENLKSSSSAVNLKDCAIKHSYTGKYQYSKFLSPSQNVKRINSGKLKCKNIINRNIKNCYSNDYFLSKDEMLRNHSCIDSNINTNNKKYLGNRNLRLWSMSTKNINKWILNPNSESYKTVSNSPNQTNRQLDNLNIKSCYFKFNKRVKRFKVNNSAKTLVNFIKKNDLYY